MTRLIVAVIEAYRRAGGGARLLGVECTFTPSCSEYAQLAILGHGLVRGSILAVRRLSRCTGRDRAGKIADPVPGRSPLGASAPEPDCARCEGQT